MVLAFQRALRRLRQIVQRSRPGAAHETTIDGWSVRAWRGWDRATQRNYEALRIATRNADEAERLGRAYFGPQVVTDEIAADGAEVTLWRLEQERPGESIPGWPPPPTAPFVARIWDPRLLAQAIGQATAGLRLGRLKIEAVQE